MLSASPAADMSEETREETASSKRDRSIKLAVVTSFVSKFGTILLQLISVPIAMRVLTRPEYGLYSTVSATLATMSLLEIGVGPALTHCLSKARAEGDEQRQRELASTAFGITVAIALLGGLAFSIILFAIPIPTLFGQAYAGKEAIMRPALWTGLALFLLLFLMNLTLRVREGHLEVAANNLWGAVGNVIGAIAVATGIWFFPDVWFLVVALFGSKVVANGFNTYTLLRKHPLMLPSPRYFRTAVAKHLFSDGAAFSTCFLITGLTETSLCAWLLGHFEGPANVALFGVFMGLTVMLLGFVVMLSTPTWPAMAEAIARDDKAWARNAARRLYLYGMAFAGFAVAGLLLLGPWIMPLWLGKDFQGISRLLIGCYCLYFAAHVWRHLNHAAMMGTGQIGRLMRIQLFESACIAILAPLALYYQGVEALLATMGMVMFLVTGTILPKRVMQVVNS